MNGFDFDGTIYSGDSTFDFICFCYKKHPGLIRYLPRQAIAFLLYAFKCIDKTRMKEKIYSFMAAIDAQALLPEFWETHRKNIFPWYPAQQQPDDILISASPEFLLEPICRELGIETMMASRVDPRTGKYQGLNCHGKEKVRRLKQQTGITHLHKFYSDSQSDLPLALIADEAYLIDKKGNILNWDRENGKKEELK